MISGRPAAPASGACVQFATCGKRVFSGLSFLYDRRNRRETTLLFAPSKGRARMVRAAVHSGDPGGVLQEPAKKRYHDIIREDISWLSWWFATSTTT
jgi:hypothetical protein